MSSPDTCGSGIADRTAATCFQRSLSDLFGFVDLRLFEIDPAGLSGDDGTIDADDFIAFINAFAIGC